MVGQRRGRVLTLIARVEQVVHQWRQIELHDLEALRGCRRRFADHVRYSITASFDEEIKFFDPVIRLFQGDPDLQCRQPQFCELALVAGIERRVERTEPD